MSRPALSGSRRTSSLSPKPVKNRASTPPAPLPGKIARLLRESRWFALVAVALFLTLILGTYERGDPGWSHSADVERIHNAGGAVGAWRRTTPR